MLKTNKSKKNVVILALSVMLAIAALFGATAAWFVASDNANGTVTTGEVKVTLSTKTLTATGKAAGDPIVSGVTVDVVSTIGTVYLRIKLTAAKAADSTGNVAEGDIKFEETTGWYYDSTTQYYYYGTSAAKSDLTEVSTTGEDDIALPTIKLANTSNAQNAKIDVAIIAEVVQTVNQGETVAWNNAVAG